MSRSKGFPAMKSGETGQGAREDVGRSRGSRGGEAASEY